MQIFKAWGNRSMSAYPIAADRVNGYDSIDFYNP